ncbi:hypothetical protein ACHAXR_009818 [Thalassiosira sp. AJA248-18]
MQSFTANGSSSSSSSTDNNNEMDEELLRKYTNRATLLETTLQTKVKQLTTMTNHVTLMEDALTKFMAKSKKEQDENGKKRDEVEKQMNTKVANLTETIQVIGFVAITTSGDGKGLTSLEQELQQLREEQQGREKQQAEEHIATRDQDLQQKVQQQEEKVQELQTQLAVLLDAHNELEQLQSDTEATIEQYKAQLKDSQEGYKSSLMMEGEEKEGYKVKWMDIQRQLEENGVRLQRMLDESRAKYEVLLDEERGKADEWKRRWEALNDEQSIVGNATLSDRSSMAADSSNTVTEEEWNNLQVQEQLEKLTAANTNATTKIQELEMQLQQQHQEQTEQQNESSSTVQKKEEQQQQLQQYLQSQLSTYYETIQDQTTQIDSYQQQIKDMEQKHEEAILIATNSVEASQSREMSLLNNIEELEGELAQVQKERYDTERALNDLQARLDNMGKDMATADNAMMKSKQRVSSLKNENTVSRQNEELALKVEQLECQIQSVSQEKEQILSDKARIEGETYPFSNQNVQLLTLGRVVRFDWYKSDPIFDGAVEGRKL